MDWIRNINISKIPDCGLILGKIGKFTLILYNNQTLSIIDGVSVLSSLTINDMSDLEGITRFAAEWSTYHRLID